MPIHLPVLSSMVEVGVPTLSKASAKTDCSYCTGPCCSLLVVLQPEEVDRFEHVEYDLGGRSQTILKRRDDGYCVYYVVGVGCSTYNDKPTVCDHYSCRDDKRITPSLKYGKSRINIP